MKAVASTPCGWHDPAPMHHLRANVFILTSARMAAGMTSRARRPEAFDPAG